MILNETLPEDVIKLDWIETYNSERRAIGMQLTRLNSNLFLMEKINSYPYALLRETSINIGYWRLTFDALGDSCILLLWKLAFDTGSAQNSKRSLNLRTFKNGIWKHLVSQEVKDKLYKKLKEIDFNNRLEVYKNNVNTIRNESIAHFDYDRNIDQTHHSKQLYISVSELKELATTACSLFDALSFGFQQHLYFGGYGSSIAQQERTDIDQMLNLWAGNNAILNMPENENWLWVDTYRKQYSEDDMKIYNTWRRRIGKHEVG